MSSNAISRLQWHPFTTIPGEQPHSMVSIIKQYGKWTGKLMDRYQPRLICHSSWKQHLACTVMASDIKESD